MTELFTQKHQGETSPKDWDRYIAEIRERLSVYDIEPFEVGFKRLRRSELEHSDSHFIPYAQAGIHTIPVFPDKVMPCSYYALKSKLAFQFEFISILYKLGVDWFDLPGIVYLNDGDIIRGLLPPFVEIYREPAFNFEPVVALQDGVHRMLTAKNLKDSITSIVISNLYTNKHYPPHKIPNLWSQLRLLDQVPPHNKKAYYRRPDPVQSYVRMRPLSAMFNPKISVVWGDFPRPTGSSK